MNEPRPVRSFLSWAFVLSLIVHAVTLPFFGLRAQAHARVEETQQTSITVQHHPKPTPPPPTPTPPPPIRTPPPSQHVVTKPHKHFTVAAVPLSHDPTATSAPGESTALAHPGNAENGPETLESAVPIAAEDPGTSEPTIAPPTETPKPSCSKPHADASVRGQAVEPDFPDSARDAGEAGTTEVRVTLAASGTVVDAEVQHSSGFPALDQEALKAARASSYSAEIVNCVPTAGQYLFTADFDAQ